MKMRIKAVFKKSDSDYEYYSTDVTYIYLIYDKKKDKFGLYDEKNEIVILEPTYDFIYDSLEEGTHYNNFCFQIKKGKEVGIIKDGKVILFPGTELEPFTDGISIIHNNQFKGVVKQDGTIIIPIKYKYIKGHGLIYGEDSDEISNKFKQKCVFVAGEEKGRKGVFDQQGRQIIPPIYFDYDFTGTSEASKNLIEVVENNEKINYLNVKNNYKSIFKKSYISTSLYSITSDLIVYSQEPDEFSIMDINENDLLNGKKYLTIALDDLNENFIRVKTRKGLNYLDRKNNFKLLSSKTYGKVDVFHNGYAHVEKDPSSYETHGLINDKGKEILAPIYRGVSKFNQEGVCAYAVDYKKSDKERSSVEEVKVGLIDKNGNIVLSPIKYNSLWIKEGSTYIGAVSILGGYQSYNYETDQFFTGTNRNSGTIDFLSKKDLKVIFTSDALAVSKEFNNVRLIKNINSTKVITFSGDSVDEKILENIEIDLNVTQTESSRFFHEPTSDFVVAYNKNASGIISVDGKIILPIIYDKIDLYKEKAHLTLGGEAITLAISELKNYGENLIKKIQKNSEEIELSLGFKPIIKL